MSRSVTHRYVDPLDAIWLEAAQRMGLQVERAKSSYASTDGHGRLILSDPDGMDPDDCLAQMILHELCHSLVQGPQSFGWVDWGLDNETERDVSREHACLRLQAALLTPLGLRDALGPTTDFRAFYDALLEDPFLGASDATDPSIVLARAALHRTRRNPWRGHLEAALQATRDVLCATASYLGPVRRDLADAPDLWRTVGPVSPLHPSGAPLHPDESLTCGSCAWVTGSGASLGCGQVEGLTVTSDERACLHFESPFDCLGCGACCREAYDTVEVPLEDPASRLHLPLLIERSEGFDMKREGPRCVCLQGGLNLTPPVPTISGGACGPDEGEQVAPRMMPGGAPFTCSIYETRPQTCRDFTIFSEHCLSARRTVGLSR